MRPENCKYRDSHEWVRVEEGDGNICVVGITDYAVKHLSDLVFLDLPDLGTDVMADEPYGEIESVKAVSDLFSPVTGEIVEHNEALLGDLNILNKDPFGDGWMVKIRMESPAELDDLMSAAAYEKYVKSEEAKNG